MANIGSKDPASPRSAPHPALSAADEAYDIRIARDGTWYYQGSPIGRRGLVRLFASVLRRDDAGNYWLITPAERGRIQVDDAPFTAVELTVANEGPDQALTFRTNIDDVVTAGPNHPIRITVNPDTGEPAPYILVREGLDALIVRSVYYELVERAVEGQDGRIGIWSQGTFFPLDGTPRP